MKRGRKKSVFTRQGRRHTIILTEKAENNYREIKHANPSFDFSAYISKCLVDNFNINPESYVKSKIGELNQEIDHRNKQIEQLKQKLDDWRQQNG
jgi:vacuolar-type H+-ATPase subunit I/STV1